MGDKVNKFSKNTLKNGEKDSPVSEKKPVVQKKIKEKKSAKADVHTKPEKNRIPFLKDERTHRVIGLFFLVFSFYLLVAFISYLLTWQVDDDKLSGGSAYDLLLNNDIPVSNRMGRMGAIVSLFFIKQCFGIASFLFVLVFLVTGLKLFLNIRLLPIGLTYKYSFFGLIWFSVSFGFFFKSQELNILGGAFGYITNLWLSGIFGNFGTAMLIIFSFLSFLIAAYNISFKLPRKTATADDTDADEESEIAEDASVNKKNSFLKNTGKADEKTDDNSIVLEIQNEPENKKEKKADGDIELEITDDSVISEAPPVEFTVEKKETRSEPDEDKLSERLVAELGLYDPKLDLRDFVLPSLDLLDDYETNSVGVQKEELENNKNRIVETLGNYNVQIDKIKATIGPTVTLYEIVPAAGVRISRIKNLEDDIALSLSALGIRIIAPIPGKGTIGIEVPNQNPEIVPMKSILSSDKFTGNHFELPVGLGKTIANESFVTDLTKMPHLLVAGATGQGKSVGLNAILTSLLYKKHPAELKFVLIDPKRVELTLYSKIERHYLAKLPELEHAIITDTKQVVRTLNSLCIEMDLRLDLMHDARVRNIKEYNEKFISRRLNPNDGHRYLPYIVLVVDEFADLIITAGREVETPITRLAQLARAIGIHLIIATQRPSVNIITGTIKANFPARLAYRVISKIDSRTILDTGGADQLIGRGDMLLSTGSDIIRLQCAFVDIHEVEKITDFVGAQRGYTDAFHLPEVTDESGDDTKTIEPSERDEFFEEAARIMVTHQQGSTSLLQRKLKLGYNRAGRIVDQLEGAGIIGPFEGSKAREVLFKDMESLEQFLKRDKI